MDMHRRRFLAVSGAAALAGSAALTRTSAAVASASANETIGVGFVGVGSRGTVHLRHLLEIAGAQVTAVCDINPDHLQRAEQMVAEAGQPKPMLTDDWRRLVERDDVDVVVSSLPCDLHEQNYLDTIAAGKDLFGEKPMCITPGECERVVQAARASDRVVQIGFQRRADPRFIQPMQRVHGGELGRIVEGRILWSNSWGPLTGWFGQRERSGDWMVEQAVHNWDVINWALQSLPVRAMGMGRDDLFRDRQPDRDVHDYYSAVVEYPGGVVVNIVHSWVAGSGMNAEYTRLLGTRASIDFNSGTFTYRPELGQDDQLGYDHPEPINNSLLALELFLQSCRDRSEPVATVEHGRDSALAALLVREAVDRGRVVTMDELRAS